MQYDYIIFMEPIIYVLFNVSLLFNRSYLLDLHNQPTSLPDNYVITEPEPS
jgi:hypothetical protein